MENLNKVPKRQWKKWSPRARKAFNNLFFFMTQNQHLFVHPDAPGLESKYFKTTAWNAAWMAADYTDGRI